MLITRKLAAIAVSAAAMTAVAASVASATPQPQDSPQSFKVDSRSLFSTGSPHDLQTGKYYFVTISGVVSYYSQQTWTQAKAGRVICGTTAAIGTPSQGQGSGVGGADAETLFAGTAKRNCGRPTPPFNWGNFLISDNSIWSFSNPSPLGGKPSRPSANHTYTYVLKGHGSEARFKFEDLRYSDNNGQLSVNIRRATSNDCKSGGWKDFGAFRNENDCSRSL